MKKIAILGPIKTYSDLCYHKFEQVTGFNLEPVYYKSMQAVMTKGMACDYTIMPFENTLEGYVQQHMDLLLESKLKIDCELSLPIDFDFVYKENPNKGNLYVQYATKNQCLKFIEKNPELTVYITDSNVESYNRYLEDPNGSAIIPNHIKEDTDHIIKSVADQSDNHTRFLVLRKKDSQLNQYRLDSTFKVSLVITPFQDRPGLLFDMLKSFSEASVNLISIMSRPTKKKIGTYHFFIELMSTKTEYPSVSNVLTELEKQFEVTVLGMYQVID